MPFDTFLANLPIGGVMGFLMLSGSVWVILSVARTNAEYTPPTKRFLLFLAWSTFSVGFLSFLWSLFLAIVPTIEDYTNSNIPPMTIDPVLLRLIIVSILFPFVSSVVFNIIVILREKNSPQYKAFLEMQNIVKLYEKTTNDSIDRTNDSIDISKRILDGILEGNVKITLSPETSESLKNQFQVELDKMKKELKNKKKPLTKTKRNKK